MYLDSKDFQTVWKLAHDWVNADPNKSDLNSLSPDLAQAIHRLMGAMLSRNISARTKRATIFQDESFPTFIFDFRHYLKFARCLRKDWFDRAYLDSLYVKRDEVLDWCTKAYLDPPPSWAPKNLPSTENVLDEVGDTDDGKDGWYEKLTEPRRRRVICIGLAEQIWHTSPGFNYKQMHEHPDMKRLGYSGKFSIDAFKKLVRRVASEPAKLAGRPSESKP